MPRTDRSKRALYPCEEIVLQKVAKARPARWEGAPDQLRMAAFDIDDIDMVVVAVEYHHLFGRRELREHDGGTRQAEAPVQEGGHGRNRLGSFAGIQQRVIK